jgi:hypothetical protein
MKKSTALLLFCWFSFALVYAQVPSEKIITGVVTDAQTNEEIWGVTLTLKNITTPSKPEKTYSGASGKYLFQIQAALGDSLSITLTQRNYKTATTSLVINSDTTVLPITLSARYATEEITVTADKDALPSVTPSFTLTKADIDAMPIFLEKDVFRAAQNLPSVVRTSDLSAQLISRGGDQTQHLILLDDVPLFSPFHLGGITGAVNADILHKADLFASAYPLQYSGVSTGVFSLETLKPSKSLKVEGTQSFVTTKAALGTPLLGGNLTLGASRTYFDVIFSLAGLRDFPYGYYDAFAKYERNLSPKHRFSVMSYFSRDVFALRTFNTLGVPGLPVLVDDRNQNPAWGNLLGKALWEFSLNETTLLSLDVYSSRFQLESDRTRVGGNVPRRDQLEILQANNTISETGTRLRFSTTLGAHRLLTGADASYFSAQYFWNIVNTIAFDSFGDVTQELFFDRAPTPYTNAFSRVKGGGFVQDKVALSSSLSLTGGIRADYLSEQASVALLPFLRTELEVANTKLYASYGRYYQALITLNEQYSTSIVSSFRTYFLPERGKLPTSQHILLGIQTGDVIPNWNLSLELYSIFRKDFPFISLVDGASRFYNESTWGADVMLKGKVGRFQGWGSYSYGFVRRESSGVFSPGNYDLRHAIKFTGSVDIFSSLKLSAAWLLDTGLPYSIPNQFAIALPNNYVTNPGEDNDIVSIRSLFSARNNVRTPLYHRLDATLTYEFTVRNVLLKPFLTVINLYNNDNSFIVDARFSEPRSKALNNNTSRGSIPVLVPILGLNFEF